MKQSIMNLDARYAVMHSTYQEWACLYNNIAISFHETKQQAQDAARAHYNDNEGAN